MLGHIYTAASPELGAPALFLALEEFDVCPQAVDGRLEVSVELQRCLSALHVFLDRIEATLLAQPVGSTGDAKDDNGQDLCVCARARVSVKTPLALSCVQPMIRGHLCARVRTRVCAALMRTDPHSEAHDTPTHQTHTHARTIQPSAWEAALPAMRDVVP